MNEVEKLSKIAQTQPHAAYAAFTHWLDYLQVELPFKGNWLGGKPICWHSGISRKGNPLTFYHSTHRSTSSRGAYKRDVSTISMSLRFGLDKSCCLSKRTVSCLTADQCPLLDRIINQDHQLSSCCSVQQSIKRRIQHTKCTKQKEDAKELQRNLPTPLQCSTELSQEKGASIWLTALPIDEHSFAFHRATFRDSLSLRYDWPLQNSPSHSKCRQPFSVEHALTCKTWGFPAVRHNEARDITTTLLTEVCLQPLSDEPFYSLLCNHRRQRLTWCRKVWILGRKIWKGIYWCEGIQP